MSLLAKISAANMINKVAYNNNTAGASAWEVLKLPATTASAMAWKGR